MGVNHDKEDNEKTCNWSRSYKHESRWFSRQVSKARSEEEERRNEALDDPKRLVVLENIDKHVANLTKPVKNIRKPRGPNQSTQRRAQSYYIPHSVTVIPTYLL